METRPGPVGPSAATAGLVTRALVGSVRLYQAARAGRPSPCRYWPSCSEYALDALREHGAARGGWMTLGRLARCHPWGGSGIDPVPVPVPVRVTGPAPARRTR